MRNRNRYWWNSGSFRPALPLFGLLVFAVLLGLFFRHGRDNASILDDPYAINIHTEIIGVAISVLITVSIIDVRNRHRDEDRRERELKDRLLREMCSAEPDVARKAFHETRRRRMMFGEESILKGEMLKVARSGTVDLSYANLSGADLSSRDLCGFYFVRTNLENANLKSVNLTSVNLIYANLVNADLEGACLTHANLVGADLTGANLLGAKIYRDNLYNHAAEWPDNADTETPQAKLPDGNPMSASTDLAYFTDEHYHGGVWRSEDPNSPAFRGHYEERQAFLQRMREYRPSNRPPPTPPPSSADPT